MTFIELTGVLGAITFGILVPLCAFFIGYGMVAVLVGVPVGILFGWLFGVALAGPLMRLNPRRRRSSERRPS